MPFLPVLHSRDEDLVFFSGYIANGQMTLGLVDGAVAGFMALTAGWIEQLYLDPGLRRRGIGRLLVDHAKASQPDLQLWCFQQNVDGRRFYEAQDFVEQSRTMGDNEAGLPDILYRWQRSKD